MFEISDDRVDIGESSVLSKFGMGKWSSFCRGAMLWNLSEGTIKKILKLLAT